MHDFDFRYGKTGHLKGRGPRGLVALAMFLIACAVGSSTIRSGGTMLMAFAWDHLPKFVRQYLPP